MTLDLTNGKSTLAQVMVKFHSIVLWFHVYQTCRFLAETKQLYEWFSPPVCLSLRQSHLLLTMFLSLYHHEIFRSDYYWQRWCTCKRSKVKVTEVKTQFSCFWTVTPLWNHIWWRNDVQHLMWHRRCALLFFKVICQISRSHRTKHFDQIWAFPDCNTSFNWQMAIEWCTKLEVA